MSSLFFRATLYLMFAAVTGMLLCIVGLIIELSFGKKEWYNKLMGTLIK